MKKIVLFHNPKAGDAEHDRQHIVSALEKNGFDVLYADMKQDWKATDLDESIDVLVVAGGDGTSRKLVGWLMETGKIDLNIPITILPLGTANNLAKTLGIGGHYQSLIPQWGSWQPITYNIGTISNPPEDSGQLYFLEAMGSGLFATHLQNNQPGSSGMYKDDPEKKIEADLEKLRSSLFAQKPVEVSLKIDDADYSDTYLMVSVMSSRYLGTNLEFNPDYSPGDTRFRVVLVPASQKDLLEDFILDQSRDNHKKIKFTIVPGSRILIKSSDHVYHFDDALYSVTGGGELAITPYSKQLHFLAPVIARNGEP
ncbi:MAG: hypothetical protein EOO02_13050 [Chitinophagaceae bacterium]|nr:MAG: hypothetical protein EOO02_13050 [Chitinophagaceae bacterium]